MLRELFEKLGRDGTVIAVGTVAFSLLLSGLEQLGANPEGYGVSAEFAPVVGATALLLWRSIRPEGWR